LPGEKNPQGRLKADEYLRIQDFCFVAGDAASFIHHTKPLRMGVQFSIMQGRLVAENIAQHIRGKSLKKFIPSDFGYIVPMANNYSCGEILGLHIKGRLATFLHFMMCLYRSRGLKNRAEIIRSFIKGGSR
ncbi:MAG: hypothetical protein KKC84_02515, partial [Candidatus Omnitrophica bacterium]|nr:hypothetical protein [Candidatus Omnitrophota bacterium]